MFRLKRYLGHGHVAPQSVVIYNYYYGFSAPRIGLETHEPEPLPIALDDLQGPARFVMLRSVHEELIESLGSIPPEACGMLLGPKKHASLITHFVRDESGKGSPVSFQIDGERMTKTIKPFITAGLDLKGIVHSHPRGVHRPSGGDLIYLKKLYANERNAANSDAAAFYFPILADGRLFHFAYDPSDGDGELRPATLALI
jgi:proteasome lid subunit RPN8/RPN11